jgi:tetratricopeptide (TPR) repeat protein
MPQPKSLLSVVACALLVSLVAGGQTQFFRGVVRTPDDHAVKNAEVQIEGISKYYTSDSGEFTFPPSDVVKVDSDVIFHVTNWVVIKPCELRNGRAYLPPMSRPIQLLVLQRGDKRLMTVTKGQSILGCVIREAASLFPPKSGSSGTPTAALRGAARPVTAQGPAAKSSRWSALLHGLGGRLGAVNGPPVSPWNAFQTAANAAPGTARPTGDVFLTAKAQELGFTLEELTLGVNRWAKSVKDPYERGLAALHEQRYEEAKRYISDSISTATGDVLERYVPLARAEYELAHYAAAASALRKVLDVHKSDPVVLNLLGLVLVAEGNYDAAEQPLLQALQINQTRHGEDQVAASFVNLAELYRVLRKYDLAEPLYKEALKIHEKILKPDDPQLATTYNNFALFYHARGNDVEAEKFYLRALAIDVKNPAPEHPNYVAATLDNLAEVYRSQKRFTEAEPLYHRALAILGEIRAPDHPDRANTLNNLALLYQDQHFDAFAEPLFMEALAIYEKVGPLHPDVPVVAENLARTLRSLRRDSEARVYEDQAASIRLRNMAVRHRATGQYWIAEVFDDAASAIGQKTLGPKYRQLAHRLSYVALGYVKQRDFFEAELLSRQALAIDEKALGPEHPVVAGKLQELALIYEDQHKYAEAEPLLKRALAIYEKVRPRHWDIVAIKIAFKLAETLHALGRDSEAKAYEERVKARIRGRNW